MLRWDLVRKSRLVEKKTDRKIRTGPRFMLLLSTSTTRRPGRGQAILLRTDGGFREPAPPAAARLTSALPPRSPPPRALPLLPLPASLAFSGGTPGPSAPLITCWNELRMMPLNYAAQLPARLRHNPGSLPSCRRAHAKRASSDQGNAPIASDVRTATPSV